MTARTIGAAAMTLAVSGIIVVQAASWSHSARIGGLAATMHRCDVGLDTVNSADVAAGLRAGDRMLLTQSDARARVATSFHYTPTQAGTAGESVRVVVQRQGRVLSFPYVLVHTDPPITFAAQMLFKLVVIGIAFFVLWRGTGSASLVLGVWCAAVGIALPDSWWGILPLSGRITAAMLSAVLWTIAPFLLYFIVESVATGVSAMARIVSRVVMVLLMLPALFLNSMDALAQAIGGCWLVPISPLYVSGTFAASQLVIVAFFALSYARTHGVAKQRVRWVFWAFLLSRAGVLLNLLNRVSVHPFNLSGIEWATVLIFPIGCTYAILRHRIIDVNFVLNRTLVYTILTTIVVGIFILAEELLHLAEAGRNVSVAVDIALALALGFSFNALHQQVEGAIERSIFRAKHAAASELRRLAQDAAFTESATTLLPRATAEIRRLSGAEGTALYERRDGEYRLRASSGHHPFPERVDVDDRALVRLRATRSYAFLGDGASALGHAGIAFPFVIRGTLEGAFVCLPRSSGEAYAPDEIALLESVTHEIGAELHAIRARRQAEVLDALVSGTIDVGQARTELTSS